MQYLQLEISRAVRLLTPFETAGAYSLPMSIQDVGSCHTIPRAPRPSQLAWGFSLRTHRRRALPVFHGQNPRILSRVCGSRERRVIFAQYDSFSGNAAHGRCWSAGRGSSDHRTRACRSTRRLAGFDRRIAGERPVGDDDCGPLRLRAVVYAGGFRWRASARSDSGDSDEDGAGKKTLTEQDCNFA